MNENAAYKGYPLRVCTNLRVLIAQVNYMHRRYILICSKLEIPSPIVPSTFL